MSQVETVCFVGGLVGGFCIGLSVALLATARSKKRDLAVREKLTQTIESYVRMMKHTLKVQVLTSQRAELAEKEASALRTYVGLPKQ
jgi:gas vesicle protein